MKLLFILVSTFEYVVPSVGDIMVASLILRHSWSPVAAVLSES